jgi:hypothetical protein
MHLEKVQNINKQTNISLIRPDQGANCLQGEVSSSVPSSKASWRKFQAESAHSSQISQTASPDSIEELEQKIDAAWTQFFSAVRAGRWDDAILALQTVRLHFPLLFEKISDQIPPRERASLQDAITIILALMDQLSVLCLAMQDRKEEQLMQTDLIPLVLLSHWMQQEIR